MHLGFDRSDYPGDAVMQSLFESTPLAFTGAYLAPAPSHKDTGWMTKVPQLRAAGWGINPIYVGQQAVGGPGSHTLTTAQGVADATQARNLAQNAGLDTGSVVYLDIEAGGMLPPDFMSYITSWVLSMQPPSTFLPGIYCSSTQTAAQVTAAIGDIPVWAFHLIDAGPSTVDLSSETARDPAQSGFDAALIWQYRQSLNGAITVNWTDSTGAARSLTNVDLDTAVFTDPSNPVLPTPVVNSVTPTSGTAGDTVTITGSEFEAVTDVGFGTVNAANVSVDSDTQISAVVPNGLAGTTVDVTATNRWGNQSAGDVQYSVT
jgi:Domain of unknown function (DUF1906)/IPT/TIG domain